MAQTAVYENILRTHPDFQTIQSNVQRIRAAHAADVTSFLNSTYIQRHVFESVEQYNKRISRAFTIPFLRGAVTKIVNAVFKGDITRSGLAMASLRPFIKDATGNGNPLSQYMGAVARAGLLFNSGYTLVDYTADAERLGKDLQNITAYDVKVNNELMPIARFFEPDKVRNWSFIPRYGFEAIVFSETRVIDNRSQTIYVYADYEIIEEFDQGGTTLGNQWEHGLGYCPVVPYHYNGLNIDADFGNTFFSGQRAVANLCSIVDEICERHAFSQLICPDDGTMAELAAKESDLIEAQVQAGILDGPVNTGHDKLLKKLSQSSVFTFPVGTGHPPSFISPDVTQLSSVWDVVKDIITMSLHAAGLTDAQGAVDATVIASTASDIGESLASHEERVLGIACEYLGVQPDVTVSYPSFTEAVDMSWLDQCGQVAEASWLTPDARRLLITNILARKAPSLPGTDYEALINGIDVKDEADMALETAAGTPGA